MTRVPAPRRLALVLGTLAAATAPTPAHATRFRWPTTAVSRVNYFVDHAPDAGLQDWRCAGTTYDGHRGTDIGAPRGTPVLAGASGRVDHRADGFGDGCLGCWTGDGFGNHVELVHPSATASIYGHMTAGTGLPALGDSVACGVRLGESGTSGNSSGPHLHFEVRVGVHEDTFYSGTHRDPYEGACSLTSPSDWTDQRDDDPSRACESGGCEACGSVPPGWWCSRDGTARRGCADGCLVTEACVDGTCERMRPGVPDVCYQRAPEGCVACGGLPAGWSCNANGSARLGCIGGCLVREACGGRCAETSGAADATCEDDVVDADAGALDAAGADAADATVDSSAAPADAARDTARADAPVRADIAVDGATRVPTPAPCTCRAAGVTPRRGNTALAALAGLALVLARRRRSARRGAAAVVVALASRGVDAWADAPSVWFEHDGALYRASATSGATDARAVRVSGVVQRVVPTDGGATAAVLACPAAPAHDGLPSDCALYRTDGARTTPWVPAGVVTFDVARDGALAYTTARGALVYRAGSTETVLAQSALWVRFDPTGRRLVYLSFARTLATPFGHPGAAPDVTVLELDTGARHAVTHARGASPVFTADGSAVLYLDAPAGLAAIMSAPRNGGPARQLTNAGLRAMEPGFAPVWTHDVLALDAATVLYVAQYNGARTLHALDLARGAVHSPGAWFAPQRVGPTVYAVERTATGWAVRRVTP